MPLLILTVVGPDRPGLVRALAGAVAAHGGSWLESRMARLAGQFAGIVLVDAPDAKAPDSAAATAVAEDSLARDLQALTSEGLRITVEVATTTEPASPASPLLVLEVVGNDRPGIVRDISNVLAASLVNIEELTTHVASGSFSGETLFRVNAFVRAPNAVAVDTVRAGLEQLGNELMVDIQPAAG